MTEKETIYIFHIFRKEGSSFFLHPFSSSDKIVKQLENCIIVGRYGSEPRVEALTSFRNDIYRSIENGVKRWLGDIRFIPKFLISSLFFVLTYFFMSYVIKDPLPVIDEIAVSLAVGIITYFLIGRRDMSSKRAAKKRLDLRIIVDRITFHESNFVKQVEQALHRNETDRLEEVIRQIIDPAQQELGDTYKEEADRFIQMLENRFNFKNLRKTEKIFEQYVNKNKTREKIKDLKKVIESGKIDFPLYAVYKSFKKTVSNLK